jgi:antitoxin component of RelBE/YafQ-DinJ toxin-antitoxin module
MGYVTINTRIPEDLAKAFEEFAKANNLTVSMALKLLILEKIKKPDSKLMPFFNFLKELYQRIDLNLWFTCSLIERMAWLYQAHKLTMKALGREELAELMEKDESKLREMLDKIWDLMQKLEKKDSEMLEEFEVYLKIFEKEKTNHE